MIKLMTAEMINHREEDGGGYRGIKAIHVPIHRNLDHEIAIFDHKARNAEAFASNHNADWAFIIDFIVIRFGFPITADDPKAIVLERFDGVAQIVHDGHINEIDGTRGYFSDGSVKWDLAMAFHDDPRDSEGVRRADDRP